MRRSKRRAHFEAERQALAMMEHPNIAKGFDAGATLGTAILPPAGEGNRRVPRGPRRARMTEYVRKLDSRRNL
jgi:hypothetical protein